MFIDIHLAYYYSSNLSNEIRIGMEKGFVKVKICQEKEIKKYSFFSLMTDNA